MNTISYKLKDDTTVELKLTAARTRELETVTATDIPSIVNGMDSFVKCCEVIAASIVSDETHDERMNIAYKIYDDFVERGKRFADYQIFGMEILVTAGFMRSEIVEGAKKKVERITASLAAAKRKQGRSSSKNS